MSKLQIATLAALAVLAAVIAFPFILPADANGDERTASAQQAGATEASYRTCFMERRLDLSGDAPRYDHVRRCTTTP